MNNLDNNTGRKREVLLILRDKDLFKDISNTDGIEWKDRPTGKVVLFNEKKEIALMGNKVNDFLLLPGGGIEKNESLLEGTKRECQEETGCGIEIIHEIGTTEDFRARDSKHCISFGYVAKVTSYGVPHLTESEIDIGAYVKWIPISEAIEIFNIQEEKVHKGEVAFYNTCFNIFRDALFIRKAKKIVGI